MHKYFLAISLILSTSCSTTNKTHSATLWMQSSAEFRASCLQSYNIATKNLLEILATKKFAKKKPAIILDLDETVLDNSAYQGFLINNGYKYPKDWDRWMNSSSAKPIAGSVEFLKLAYKKGVEIFYVSNRKVKYFTPTFENLININVPVKKYNIMLKTDKSSKEIRRMTIKEKYEVIMLLGDNLSDFHQVYDLKSTVSRKKWVKEFSKDFGSSFIIFPNPMYGDWEYAIKNDNGEKSLFQGF